MESTPPLVWHKGLTYSRGCTGITDSWPKKSSRSAQKRISNSLTRCEEVTEGKYCFQWLPTAQTQTSISLRSTKSSMVNASWHAIESVKSIIWLFSASSKYHNGLYPLSFKSFDDHDNDIVHHKAIAIGRRCQFPQADWFSYEVVVIDEKQPMMLLKSPSESPQPTQLNASGKANLWFPNVYFQTFVNISLENLGRFYPSLPRNF